jgi:hypothetical protein
MLDRQTARSYASSIVALVLGIVLAVGGSALAGISLLRARRARGTQAGFCGRIYLHRLPPEDREAALALLDETAAARRG